MNETSPAAQNEVAPVTSGLVTGVAIYSATFASLIANGWEALKGAGTSVLIAAAPALFVGMVTSTIQRESARRNNVAQYAIEEALELALDDFARAEGMGKLAQAMTMELTPMIHVAAIPALRASHAWTTLLLLDDPLAKSATAYTTARENLLTKYREATSKAAAAVEARYSAVRPSTTLAAFPLFNRDLLGRLIIYERLTAGTTAPARQPQIELRRVSQDAPNKEIRWHNSVVAEAPAADTDLLRSVIVGAVQSPEVGKIVSAVEADYVAFQSCLTQLVREMEAIRRFRVLRSNTVLRRRKLKSL